MTKPNLRNDCYGLEIEAINIEGLMSKKFAIEDYYAFRDLEKRRLFLEDDIDEVSAGQVIDHILWYNEQDDEAGLVPEKRTPIRLYISSCGGSVVDGLALCDIIQCSATPVYTIVTGYAYSMAVPIALSGDKRFATENSSFLIHDGSNILSGSASKTEDTMEFSKRLDKHVRNVILKKSIIDAETLENNHRKEWYLFADEAKTLGMVDQIIGIDCSLNVLK